MKKGAKSRLVVLSLMIMFVSVVFIVGVSGVGGDRDVQAHDPIIKLFPESAKCGDSFNEFVVNVRNTAGNPIYNVKIPKSKENVDEFECGSAPDRWFFRGFINDYCEYQANDSLGDGDTIASGEDLNFSFKATIPVRESCGSEFKVITLDNAALINDSIDGQETKTPLMFSLDCSDPVIVKSVGEPKKLIDPDCNPEDTTCGYWITDDTSIDFVVNDSNSPYQCDLGLEYCEYKITLDGEEGPWVRVEGSMNSSIDTLFDFSEEDVFNLDSNHEIEVVCYDRAGNMDVLTELDKVDSTPPTITKTMVGPHSGQCPPRPDSDDVCYVDSATSILIDSVDPDPTGMSCNIEDVSCEWRYRVSKTWEFGYCNFNLLNKDGCVEVPWSEWNDSMVVTFPEESYHELEIVCVDGLGNEVVDREMFVVDKTPPVLKKSVGEPSIGFPYLLSVSGSGVSEEGEDGIHLVAPKIVNYPPSNEGRIHVPTDMALDDLSSVSWDADVVEGYAPHVDVLLDLDDDGLVDDSLVFEYAKVDPLDCDDSGDYPVGEISTFDDKGIVVDGSAYAWLNSGPAGPCGDAVFDASHKSLADWKTELSGARVLALEIEVDGWISDSEAYVSSVEINGQDMVDFEYLDEDYFHYVTNETEITLSCEDVGPHPSNNVTIYWRYRVNEGQGFDEWKDFSENAPEVSFNFPENSMHELEAWCVDAVEKESEHDVEVFKVDSEPPTINKTIVGPQLGDCPPRPGSEDKCYITSETQIFVEGDDGDSIHAVDDVSCYWWYFWEGDRYPSSGHNSRLPIMFEEDSEHNLTVVCKDALGNRAEDVETFLVDLEPPETVKTYVGSQFPEGLVYPKWITSNTLVVLNSSDEKSGVNQTFWRNLLIEDEDGWEACYNPEKYCNSEFIDQFVEDEEDFQQYFEPFTKKEESCHVIEYYSVDMMGNREETKRQCVFVDNSAPMSEKIIGEPKVVMCSDDDIVVQGRGVASDGDNLRQINGSYSSSCSVNTGLAFDGANLLVSCWDHNVIDVLSPVDGSLVDTITVPGYSGLHANAWDGTRSKLWQCAEHNKVILVDTSDGSSVLYAHDGISCTDGLAYDGSDDTLWISPDVSDIIYHYQINNDNTLTLITSYPLSGLLGGFGNSGIAVGGDKLYLANNGGSQIYEAEKSLSNTSLFASFPERLEDMECDDITFANLGVGAIWSQDAYDRIINAYEIPQGKCGFGGLPASCGDGNLDLGEQCDDGNNDNGDGCSASCRIEDENLQCDYYITQETNISISCEDGGVHPVDHSSLHWRYNINGLNWTDWMVVEEGELTFTFPEDSEHTVEYYCVDVLGNEEEHNFEIDIVDTMPPVINKTMNGPYFGQCPPRPDSDDVCYVDTATSIHVDVVDSEPHPVGGVECSYSYEVIDERCVDSVQDSCGGHGGGADGLIPPFDIKFPEESKHDLWITCTDALGNVVEDHETFVVDKSVPIIEKYFEGPYYSEKTEGGLVEWVNFETLVFANAYDPEPHPSGLNRTEYRVTLVDDFNCRNQDLCAGQNGTGNWDDYTEDGFSIREESCHLIEIKATDNVEKSATHKQCVFVDNTSPTSTKTVGEPKTPWDGSGVEYYTPEWGYDLVEFCATSGNCWKTTLFTPISLTCGDPVPHPVNHEKVYFKIESDRDDITEDYCPRYNGTLVDIEVEGKNVTYCKVNSQIQNFRFTETSEHNLAYFCEDGLGNRGEIDDEKFKVEETAFTIQLNHKWNLISVPVKLLNNQMDEVFKDLQDEVKSVWSYDPVGGVWLGYTPDGLDNDDLTTMVPGEGYWILVDYLDEGQDYAELVIGGSLISPAMTPPVKQIVHGWNLIGYYGVDGLGCGSDGCVEYRGPSLGDKGKPVYCALKTLGEDYFDIVGSSMMTWWQESRIDLDTENGDFMNPGAGYWMFSNQFDGGLYGPSTGCSL